MVSQAGPIGQAVLPSPQYHIDTHTRSVGTPMPTGTTGLLKLRAFLAREAVYSCRGGKFTGCMERAWMMFFYFYGVGLFVHLSSVLYYNVNTSPLAATSSFIVRHCQRYHTRTKKGHH